MKVLATPAASAGGAPPGARCWVVRRVTVDVLAAPRHDVVVYDQGLVPGASPLSRGLWRAKLAKADH